MKSKKLLRILAVPVALALVAASCGDDDDEGSADTEAPATEAPAETDAPAETEAPAETDAPAATEAPPEVDAVVAAFDANGDGNITIGVAAAGPRDDNGYYQSLVDFAEEFSAENGFEEPIVSDNIGAAEAAQAMADLAEQGVDIMFVGASEIAEPLPDLTEQYPEIFWYCNCGAGFAELPAASEPGEDVVESVGKCLEHVRGRLPPSWAAAAHVRPTDAHGAA